MAEFAISAEGLHEPLHRAKVVDGHEMRFVVRAGTVEAAEVVVQKFRPLIGSERDVRVEQKRGEVVLSQARTQPLKVDEADFAVANDDVLALKIAVNEAAWLRSEMLANLQETLAVCVLVHFRSAQSEMALEAVFDEIILLPFVERGVEFLLEMGASLGSVGAGVEDERLVQRSLVKCAPLDPRSLSKAPQIRASGVFHEDETLGLAVEKYARNAHAHAVQKFTDSDVVAILGALFAVADKDERSVGDIDAPEFAARAAFFDWFYGNRHGDEMQVRGNMGNAGISRERLGLNDRCSAVYCAVMMNRILLIAWAFSVASLAERSPVESASSFVLADAELTVELVAAEPLVASPCAMAFDERGRIIVAENRGYPNTIEPAQGRIALLADADGDGRFEKRTTFAEGLTFPNGVLPWRGGVIVTCAPDVLFLRDTNDDGVADERRVLLTGFATTGSTQLRVNAPTLGPDGWIYFAAGLSGGEVNGVKMTGDLRWNPDTGAVENVAGRSQYGMSFDAFGNRFICMNRVQAQHVVFDPKWLRRNPHLLFSDTVQNCPELIPNTLMRSTGGAARLFPVSANITTADSHQGFFSAACAVHVWRGCSLPARYDGHVFSCDPTANVVHLDRLEPAGGTFSATPFFKKKEFLASRDDSFRPVFLSAGPDGALYICDMTRKVIEHPDYLPEEVRKRTDFETGKTLGRIWRVKGSGKPRKATDADDLFAKARAGKLDAAAMNEAWNAGDAQQRALVLRLWLENKNARDWMPDPSVLAQEPDAAVRFWAALALGEIREGAPALGVIAAKDADDRWTRAAVLSSIAGREAEFLGSFFESTEKVGEGTCELLRGVGRSFASVAALKSALGEVRGANGFGRDGLGAVMCSLVLGSVERSREVLNPKSDPTWLGAILDGIGDVALDATRPDYERLTYIRTLSKVPWSDASPALLVLAANGTGELRTAAIRALAGFPQPEVAKALLAPGVWAGASPSHRELLLSELLGNPVHHSGVLDAVEEGRLPASAVNAARRAVFLKNEELRERAEKLLGTGAAPDRQKAFESAKAALALKSDAKHGAELFRQACAICHRLEREGHAVGPDLFDIRGQTKENILFHIIVPDAEIAPAFAAYLVTTKDGRTLSGIMASETPASLTLRGPLAQETVLPRADVTKLEALPFSLMPAGLEQGMSPQDIADLLGFLKGEAAR
jgi:putative membrane-bound dehydrogenase-like protein